MDWRDRLKTIFVTAVLTSLAWIVAGLVLYGPPSAARMSDRSGLAEDDRAGQGQLVVPVQGVRREQLSDTWGQSRENGQRAHEAIDILAPRGTPVLAAAPGVVEKLFVSARGGNTIYVRSADRRMLHYYAHLDRYAPGIGERRPVRAGQVIAFVGATGDAAPDAPHLHFGISRMRPDDGWWQGEPINPYPLLRH